MMCGGYPIAKWVTSRFYGKGLGKYPFLVKAQQVMLDLLTPKYKTTTINGYKLKVGMKMGGIGRQIVFEHRYEPVTTTVFNALLGEISPQSVVVDVGAHIGYYSILAGKEGFKVYAFEPNPETYRLLEYNCRLNNLHNIRTYWAAAWDIACTRLLGVCREAGAGSLVNLDKLETSNKPA